MLKTPEEQQKIKGLEISEHGEVIKYRYEGKELEKSIPLNKFSATSIIRFLEITRKDFYNFVKSTRFDYCLHLIDPSYKIPNFVYLIILKGKLKIGRTHDIDKRYHIRDLKDNLKRLVFVGNNVEDAENELKEKFSNLFTQVDDHLEFFKEFDLQQALRTFDAIVEKYEIPIPNNKQIDDKTNDKNYGRDVFLTDKATRVVLSAFSDMDDDEIGRILLSVSSIYDKVNQDDFIAVYKHDNDEFYYWKYHGYVILVNMTNETVNISRLWKTAADVENYHGSITLSKFLKSKRITSMFPPESITHIKYIPKPLMNGRWGSILFVHFVLYQLSSKYTANVAIMVTRMIFERKFDIRTGEMDRRIAGGNYFTAYQSTNVEDFINDDAKEVVDENTDEYTEETDEVNEEDIEEGIDKNIDEFTDESTYEDIEDVDEDINDSEDLH